MKRYILAAFFLFMITGSAYAEETHVDFLARNLIFLEGESEIIAPINGFSLTFDYDVDRATFTESCRDSGFITDGITNQIKALGLKDVKIIKGWDIMRQAMISFGAKGRKVSNRLTIEVTNYPEGKLLELIAQIVDIGISTDKAVTLQSLNVFMTNDLEASKKEEAISEALKALQSNAKKAAESLGYKTVTPKRVFITDRELLENNDNNRRYASDKLSSYEYEQVREQRSLVSVQKSFRVNAQIVDGIKMKAKVAGIYQIE